MPRPFEAPLPTMRAALERAARTARLERVPGCTDTLADVAGTVLEGAARIAREVLSPLNGSGDAAGCRIAPEGVVTPAGFREAYRRFRADGWPSLAAPESLGGQALPRLLGAAATEMWGGANLAFAMCPEAAVGAIEALCAHASPELAERYARPLVTGEWTAAMAMTEPQSGSDLSTIRALATPAGDEWRLVGRKIFISWGDHDLAQNIVHLVLARTPGAPPGLRGLSLFVVPKGVPGADGRLERNDLRAVSLEHKMGIHASPTCVMAYGEREGARAFLVGPPGGGIGCMFTMMNTMRLGVGLHSTGLAERAFQLARDYAQERLQGRDASGGQRPIIEHADVRRMLLTMKVLTHASRGLAYTAAATLDVAHSALEPAERERAAQRASLLTPLVKAWCSDTAVEVASLGVQVHGGAGYIEESEIAQVYRDARIGPIFEGTNYIQALDLIGRKVIRDGGAALESLLEEIEASARALTGEADWPARLREECGALRAAARTLVAASAREPQLPGCIAQPFLQWLAVVAGGWQWALTALEAGGRAGTDPAQRALLDAARFYAAHILPRARLHAAQVASGTSLLAGPERASI